MQHKKGAVTKQYEKPTYQNKFIFFLTDKKKKI